MSADIICVLVLLSLPEPYAESQNMELFTSHVVPLIISTTLAFSI